jgi:hypothetical protein
MDMNSSAVRVAVTFAVGLAALAGLDAAMRALSLPHWLPRLAVLVGFVIVIAVAIVAGVVRKPSNATVRK